MAAATDSSPPELTVIVPLYNEADVFGELRRRLSVALDSLALRCEILLVDDGSTDSSPRLLRDWASTDRRVRGIVLSRNFGQQLALSAGLSRSRGDAVVLLDADLKDPPEMIAEMIDRWRQGYKVVYGVRRHRREGLMKRLAYALFYRTLRTLSPTPIPLDAGDFCLLDRRVVEWIVAMPERGRFLRGLRGFVGFPQIGLPYDRPARAAGIPKYSVRKLFALALDGVLSFSPFPLRIASVVGFLVALSSLAGIVFYLLWWWSGLKILGKHPQDVAGFMTMIILLLFFAGLQFLFLGILGEYVGRVYLEVKQRPGFIVAEEIPAPVAESVAER